MEIKGSKKDKLEKFIIENNHPCIMSQTIFSSENYEINSYAELGSATAASKLLVDLNDYIEDYNFSTNEFFSFTILPICRTA